LTTVYIIEFFGELIDMAPNFLLERSLINGEDKK
jgi:hypothetical protein